MSLFSETDRLFDRLEEQQARTLAAVESLSDAVTRLTRNAEADRANFLQKAEADQVRWTQAQAEIRQIWEYLLGQQRGNGRGEG